MFNAVHSSTKSPNPASPSTNLPQLPHALPPELGIRIVRFGSRVRDLIALSVLSKSWKEAFDDVLKQVRAVAFDHRASEAEGLTLGKYKTRTYAQDFAWLILSGQACTRQLDPINHAKLSNNLPRLWKDNRAIPRFWDLAIVLFNMHGLEEDSWQHLLDITPRKGAFSMLMHDPQARELIRPGCRDAVMAKAGAELEKHLEEEGTGSGGALWVYSNMIDKFGKSTGYAYPFHRILFASLLYRPLAFYGLIELAAGMDAADFTTFSARVQKHFHSDANVLFALQLGTARWLALATKDDLSDFPPDQLEHTIMQIRSKCVMLEGLTLDQYRLVIEVRATLLANLAKKAPAILEAIPVDAKACRKRIQSSLKSMEKPDKWVKTPKKFS
jgi:hypothetical protein